MIPILNFSQEAIINDELLFKLKPLNWKKNLVS